MAAAGSNVFSSGAWQKKSYAMRRSRCIWCDAQGQPSRLLKNGHLLLSSPLTFSRACQELLLTRRNGTSHPSILQQPRNEEGKRVEEFAIKRQEDFFNGFGK